MAMATDFRNFLSNDAGAITIDWVTLTAGILLAGMVAIYAIYGNGVSSLVVETNNLLVVHADLDPGEAKNLNQ